MGASNSCLRTTSGFCSELECTEKAEARGETAEGEPWQPWSGELDPVEKGNMSINPHIATVDKISREDGRIFFKAAIEACEHNQSGESAILLDYDLRVEHLVRIAKQLQCTDYSEEVLRRVHNAVPKDERGQVGLREFTQACDRGQAVATLTTLVSKYRRGRHFGFSPPADYNYSKSTSQNYKQSSMRFIGEFADIRKERDYTYHVNYTEARQAWQDAAIKSTISRTVRQPEPWIVYTCGPMGVGKGYALDWLSRHGFFPLESIVHVDPDAFKLSMPEWSQYVERISEEAGSMCHQESCFMMEIAQEGAMNLRQNVWIDGSLRNADFYASQFQDIRARFPQYSIAIFYVTAPEATIRTRIAQRAKATGRDVPEHLIVASLGAMDRSLNVLTPLADFVARIDNGGAMPVLKAFESINTSGAWETVQERFARTTADTSEFPNALAPFAMGDLREDAGVRLLRQSGGAGRGKLLLELSSASRFHTKLKAMLPPKVELTVSPGAPINFDRHDRELAKIPLDTTEFFWIYPYTDFSISSAELKSSGCTAEELKDPVLHLLRRGAFAYAGASGELLQVSVVMGSDVGSQGYLQFGKREHLKGDILAHLPPQRFQPTPRRFREASSFVWFLPNEKVGNDNIGGPLGCFVFQVQDCVDGRRHLFKFPVMGR